MSARTYCFTIFLQVDDEEALHAAAKERAAADGYEVDAMNIDAATGDKASPETCLVTLLDPGSLPGCSIIDAGAECVRIP